MPCFPRSATDRAKAVSPVSPAGPEAGVGDTHDAGSAGGPAVAGGRRGRGSPRAAERGPPPRRGVGAALSAVLKEGVGAMGGGAGAARGAEGARRCPRC